MGFRDRASRHVLAWRLSNTLDAGFCTDALDEALDGYGTPEIFNTDQGSQFTSFAFTGRRLARLRTRPGPPVLAGSTASAATKLFLQTPAAAYRNGPPVDMVDKPLRALTTDPQAQHQQQKDRFKGILAA